MNTDFPSCAIAAEQLLIASSEIDLEDYKAKNKITDDLNEIYQVMKKIGIKENEDLIKQFTDSDNDEVRLWFATILLPLDESFALNVIKEIIAKENVIALNAELALDMWKSGDLKL